MHHHSHRSDTSDAIAQRKRQLLAEGAVYRASLAVSMHEVKQSLQADSLAKRAAGFAVSTALGMFKARTGGIGVQAVLPLAIEAFSMLSKRSLLKKALRIAAVFAAVAGAANMFLRKKNAEQEPDAGKTS